MRRGTRRGPILIGLLVMASTLPFAAPVAAVSTNVVISQVYGGGGNANAPYQSDFIELFNRGNSAVSLAGWSVQYASSSGTSWAKTDLSSVTLQPGQYYLVKESTGTGCSGLPCGAPIPVEDALGSIFMSATGAKVALVNNNTLITSGTSCPVGTASVVDFVGWGSSTNCFETTVAASTANDTSSTRDDRCVDTDNNFLDFNAVTPNPHNTGTTLAPCGVTTPSLSVNDVSASEGNGGTTSFDFTVSLSAAAGTGGVTFDIATADGSAVAPGDYTANALTGQTIAAGDSTYNFSVLVNGDTTDEPVETFLVNVTNISGANVGDPQGQGTINNDDTDVCAASYTQTYRIQGTGNTAAMTGTQTTQGVVVGDFEGPTSAGLQGFFIQDVTGDGNTATSDGLFVFRGNTDSSLDVGDVVRVTGNVSEFNAQTQITATAAGSLIECGTATPPAVIDIDLPQATSTELERYEGMRVRFPQELVISEYFEYEQFGEIVLGLPVAGEDRLFTPTHLFEPGSAEQAARQSLNERSQVRLNDGLANSNPTSLRHPDGSTFSLSNYFRGGDIVADAVGILGERTSASNPFPRYRIEPTGPATFTAVNPRPATPDDTDGRVTVAAQNTLNFFLTADIEPNTTPTAPGDNVCGGNANLECRGWDSNQPQEFNRQRDKLLATLAGINADVIGLNEIENTPGVDPVGDPTRGIVVGLNAILGAGTYDSIDTGVIGTDAIRVGMIYKPGSVTPVGDFEILDSSDDPRFIDTKSRPVLAQTFEENATGSRFTVAVNHLKSKGSSCLDVGDADLGVGAANCNGTRTLAAQALVDWLATDPTDSGDSDFLIVGDLNSYAMEDPIDAIKAGSDDTAGTGDDFTNLVSQFLGSHAYSYVFDAQNGYLDHALSSSTLTSQVTGVTEWHNNADEADVFDYDTTFKPPAVDALYEPKPYRASDHDSIIVGLDLDTPPVITSLTGPTTAVRVGTSASFSATWTDVNEDDTFSTTWDWGDSSTDTTHSSATSPDSASHTYAAAGFYTVTFTVTDSTGLSDTGTLMVVVYDPAAGRVTGSGTYAGGGSFSLSASYNPSATAITGTSSFSAPGVTFVTGTVDWLVVSGNRATYTGTGTYNGNTGYRFLIAVSDGGSPGSRDRVRFQVSDSGGNVVYDTQPGAAIDVAPTTTPTSGNVTVRP